VAPPGKIKVMDALGRLLATKEFSCITTAEIAKEARVTEGLIYKYFDGKQDLLFQVLKDLFAAVIKGINDDLKSVDGAMEKLTIFVNSSIKSYAKNRVFSKIILLEVRMSPNFFQSDAYLLVKEYSKILKGILLSGINEGEIKPDIDITHVSEILFGAIEHTCLHGIIFNKDIAIEQITTSLCDTILNGIKKD
jgi:AcrR family transcriptional regulator